MAIETISYHLTRAAAEGRRFDLAQEACKKRSRIDYGVERTDRTFKRWRVYAAYR